MLVFSRWWKLTGWDVSDLCAYHCKLVGRAYLRRCTVRLAVWAGCNFAWFTPYSVQIDGLNSVQTLAGLWLPIQKK